MKILSLLSGLLAVLSLPALAAGVATFSPQGEVRAPQQVRVGFATPMVRLGDVKAPAPLSWDCRLDAKGHWVDEKNWVLDIAKAPPANTRCRFNTRPGLQDLQGAALPAVAYAFFTGAPSIVQSWPRDGERIEEDQAFVLRVNARPASLPGLYCQSSSVAERLPMVQLAAAERAALLRHLELDKDAASVLTLRCSQRLAPDSKVVLTNPRAGSRPERLDFQVRPPFTATLSCARENARGACLPFKPVTLNFSSPVPQQLAAAIRLQGGGAERAPRAEQGGGEPVDSVSFAPPFAPQSELTLTLPRGFADEVGRPLTNAARFPLPLRIADFPPLAKFSAAPFGIIEAGDDASLPLTLRGVEAALPARSVQLGGQAMLLQDDRAMMSWLGRVLRYHESSIPQGKKDVESRRLSLLKKEKSARTLALPAAPDAKGRWPFQVLGIPLKARGLHVVELESRVLGRALLGADKPMYVRTAALVTNLAVHFKRSPENAAVWVTTLDRAQPVAGAEVRVYDCRQQLLWQGKTGRDGVARIPERLDEARCSDLESLDGLFVSARTRDDMSFVRSGWNRGIESWRFPFPTASDDAPSILAHNILDRTLLRAGETVSMKHLLRVQNSRGLSLLAAGALPQELRISHDGSGDEYSFPLSWRQGRYAETTFALPKDAKLGEYSLHLVRKGSRTAQDSGRPSSPQLDGYTLYSGGFRVEEFRLPAMRGSIQARPGVAAASVPLTVNVSWGNGGPARNWPLEVSAMLQPRYESPAAYEGYRFSPPRRADGEEDASLDGKVVLDKAALRLDANGNGRLSVDKLPRLDRPYWMVTEAALRDPNGEMQTVSRHIPLWPSALQLGVAVDDWVAVGRKLDVKVVALDTQGRPQAGRAVTLRAVGHRYLSTRKRLVGGFYAWEHSTQSQDRGELCRGKTDARGLLICEVQLADEGNVELVAQAADDAGNKVAAAQEVWVSRHDELWFDVDSNDRIDILPEKPAYEPGQTARFQVRMPFRKATAWLAVEREGVMETRVLELEGKNPVLELPVKADWGPNVYVSVLAVRGRVREVPWYSFFSWGWRSPRQWWDAYWNEGKDYTPPTSLVDLSRPAFKYGVAQIAVGDKAHRLQVSVKPEKGRYGVRETARVRVQVKMPDGKPAPKGSELAFAAVDEALLALQPNDSWKLMEAMARPHSYGVETATAQLEVVGKRHYGRKALPPGGGGGKAPTRELFDTLLTWQPVVKLDETGSATVAVPINDSLTRFRLAAVADVGSGFFGTGDAVIDVVQDLQLTAGLPPLVREGDQIQAAVTVKNGSERPQKLRLTASWGGGELAVRQLELPAGEARQISWPFTVPQGVSELNWSFAVQEVGGRASDRLKTRQQVESAVPVTVQQATLLRLAPSLSLPVGLPPGALPGRGGVRVSLQPTLGNTPPGVRRWLEDYPYVCLEQRTSVALGLGDDARWTQLQAELPLYLDRQGLAAYFPLGEGAGDAGSDVLTSYLLLASAEAGRTLPDAARERMLDGLTAFVEGRLARQHHGPRQDLDARRLSAMLALQRHGRFRAAWLDVLTLEPQRWSTAMLIDWLDLLRGATAAPARTARMGEATQLLRSRLSLQGTRMTLSGERGEDAWWLMGNGDANAARLVLLASRLPQWQADLPRLVTGLIGRQQRGHWQTTTANLWGSLALARFGREHETISVAGRSVASLGGAEQALDWSRAASGGALATLPWPAGGKGTLALSHQGSGAPWATVSVDAAVKLQGERAAGYRIRKTLTPVSQRTPGRYQVGDVLKVTLDVTAQSDMGWVVVDDPVPAGASVLGGGLGNDSAIQARAADGDGADYVERRFGRYRAYYGFVPRGSLRVEYTLRLNTPGSYQLPPTRVEAMYAPEVFGMLANPPFRVNDGQ